MNNIAASILLKARRNPRGLEALPEGHLLRGVFEFQDTRDLTEEDRRVLIDAAVMLFLQNNICFRESFGAETLLVFPALINLLKPRFDELEAVDGASTPSSVL